MTEDLFFPDNVRAVEADGVEVTDVFRDVFVGKEVFRAKPFETEYDVIIHLCFSDKSRDKVD